jgi:hypothetical protein
MIYNNLCTEYRELTKMLGMKRKNGKRVVTFHRLRAFVKSTISDLGYQDYSEWYLGHIGSTYYRKTERERLQIFRKIEPYITYLDVESLESSQRDLESKMQAEIDSLNKRLADVKSLVAAMPNIPEITNVKDKVYRACRAAVYKGKHITKEEWLEIKKKHPYARLDHERKRGEAS